MIEWFSVSGKPMLVFSPRPTSSRAVRRRATLADVKRQLSGMGDQVNVLLFSSLKKTGVEEVEAVVARPGLTPLLPPSGAEPI
jgi:GTP-binding protein